MSAHCARIISLLFLHFYLTQSESLTKYNLVSLNVFFRHGDRTPTGKEGNEWYPNDPYANYTYEPLGLGALTNEGKLREFALGQALRQRYDAFLGTIYKPTFVRARSTDKPRTKMSTQLALAGLYPPKDSQIWNKELDWQPIPVSSTPSFLDPIFKWEDCPLYVDELARVQNSVKYKREVSKYSKVIRDLEVITGSKLDTTIKVFFIYHLLVAQQAAKLELPEWTKDYYPNGSLLDITLFEYQTQSYNLELKKFTGGLTLGKVFSNMKLSMDQKNLEAPKFFLYGVHESNLGAMLISLNVWKWIVPQYSSAIIFELHEKDSNYYVKLVYYKGIPAEYETLILPECTEYCPLEKFIELNQVLLSKDPFEKCFGPYKNSKLVPEGTDPIKWMYEKFENLFEA